MKNCISVTISYYDCWYCVGLIRLCIVNVCIMMFHFIILFIIVICTSVYVSIRLSNGFIQIKTWISVLKSRVVVFMPPPFEEWWRGIKCYPYPCVRSCVRPSVRASVRPLSKFGVRSITFERLHQIWYVDI